MRTHTRGGLWLLLGLTLLSGRSALGQDADESASFRWKLEPKELLGYRCEVRAVSGPKVLAEFAKAPQRFLALTQDKPSSPAPLAPDSDLSALLSGKLAPVATPEAEESSVFMLWKSGTGVALRQVEPGEQEGTWVQSFSTRLDASGRDRGFWNPPGVRNLTAFLFEMPSRSVRKGEGWGLDAHLLLPGSQAFNPTQGAWIEASEIVKGGRVTLTKIRSVGAEQIASFQLLFCEHVKGEWISPGGPKKPVELSAFVAGRGQFSLTRGRLLNLHLRASGGTLATGVDGEELDLTLTPLDKVRPEQREAK